MKAPTFFKMHGCGNDFIFFDRRDSKNSSVAIADMPRWATTLCDRHTGIGADGIGFLDIPNREISEHSEANYIWHFYNADGSRSGMCGNAARCAAWLAVMLGIAGLEQCLGTDAGLIYAQVSPGPAESGRAEVSIALTPPTELQLGIELDIPEAGGQKILVHSLNTGVPHIVVYVDELAHLDIVTLGRLLRYHAHFPAGTNVNFVQVLDKKHIQLRTYERGVEAETQACGTGATASVFISAALGLTADTVNVKVKGGELTITLPQINPQENTPTAGRPLLSGAAELVFTGVLANQCLTQE